MAEGSNNISSTSFTIIVEDIKQNVKLHGYKKDDPLIQMFWSIFEELSG